MNPSLTPNTQAILLLIAPLILGSGPSSNDLLTPGEYKRLARHLREMQRQPADLLAPDAAELLHSCHTVVDEERLKRLLDRGFLLGQAIEHWQARAIWVISRADAEYPRRLKARLREDTPAILYGCGDIRLLENGGLAVVGSRHVDDALVEYTRAVGQLTAQSQRALISGGARGIDQAAMQGAVEARGKVIGVLADSLQRTIMNREHRNLLIDGQLVLLSPYDPNAGFNVGNAMQRNKLIYALANAALVVSSDLDKGGTWAGAVEQLKKLKFVPVYVRSTGEGSPGLDALRSKGALDWPNPSNAEEFTTVLDEAAATASSLAQPGPDLFEQQELERSGTSAGATAKPSAATAAAAAAHPSGMARQHPAATTAEQNESGTQPSMTAMPDEPPAQELNPAQLLFAAVRESMSRLLTAPMNDAAVAQELAIAPAQAKAWLKRLLDEGLIEKQKKPAGYVVKKKGLFVQANLKP